jgi:signal transduction histidine kinase
VFKLIDRLNQGRLRLYYITFFVALFGYGYNLLTNILGDNGSILFMLIGLVCFTASWIIYKLKIISLSNSYAIFIYSFLSISIATQFISIEKEYWTSDYFILDGLITALFCGFAALMVKPYHSLVISFIYIVCYIIISTITQNTFLLANLPINLIMFIGFSLGVYYFFKLFEKLVSEQERLIETVSQQNKEILQHNEELQAQRVMLTEANRVLERHRNEIVNQRDDLKKTNDTKNMLLSVISHDLKNPIGSILNYSGLAESRFDSIDDEKKKSYFVAINQQTDKTYKLLESLLKWARSQSGNIEIVKEEIEMAKFMNATLDVFKEAIKEKDLSVQTNFNCITIISDKEILATIIRNLVSNAIKFSFPKGNIFIGCQPLNEELEIYIQDEGIGIPESIKDKLFGIDRSKIAYGTSNEVGTGLGLMICKSFLEMLNGRIKVESEESKGTKFTILLPMEVLSTNLS